MHPRGYQSYCKWFTWPKINIWKTDLIDSLCRLLPLKTNCVPFWLMEEGRGEELVFSVSDPYWTCTNYTAKEF